MAVDLLSSNILRFLDAHPAIRLICFDFFDTLVYRIVEPEHTKKLAARQLSFLMKDGFEAEQIYRLRSQLERNLCRENTEKDNDPEFNILDLADALYQQLNRQGAGMPNGFHRGRFQNIFVDIEIAVETFVQRVFPDTLKLLETCKNRGYRTAVASDFYVPSRFFQKFLRADGLYPLIDRVMVSCDFCRTKASGRLYDKLLSASSCEPDEVMMIGDNAHSDIHMAQEKGIYTYHVDRRDQRRRYRRWIVHRKSAEQRQKALQDRLLRRFKRRTGNLFPEMAATLWRFTSLLFERLIRDEVEDIFFLSKEGEFLKSLFDLYQQEQFGAPIIRSHYLLASRKSTFVCSLKPLHDENFSRLFYQYHVISPRDFLLSLNFTEAEAKKICIGIPLDYEERSDFLGFSKPYISILQNPDFVELFESKRKFQRKNFFRYLRSFGVDFKKDGLHLVDVGWKGSIQDNIFFCFNAETMVHGYYLGLLNPTHLTDRNRKRGILFANTPEPTPFLEVYNSNRSLFEMLLSATHGSADGYVVSDSPEASEIEENVESKAVGGSVGIQVLLRDMPRERSLYTEQIQPIQQHLFDACREMNRNILVEGTGLSEEWVARQHARMIYWPKREEISFFESLYHLENFGVFEFTEFDSSVRPPLKERVRNLREVVKDPDQILQTGIWAPVVLKRMGLGFYSRLFGRKRYWTQFPHRRFRLFESGFERVSFFIQRLKPKKRIRIAFILGSPDICGGTYVIIEHASKLQSMGYSVFILTEHWVDPTRYRWHPDAGELRWLAFKEAENFTFDYVIATWWMSVYFLRQFSAANYVYFTQSIESRFFPEDRKALYHERLFRRLSEKSYTLPLPVITIAHWIREYLWENYDRESQVVLNGIRKDIYTESGESYSHRTPGRLRVLVEGPLGVTYKNVERAVALARRSDADEVWLLTSSAVLRYPGVDRVFSQVPIYDTPKVYRSCDVLLKMTSVEGMFGPPLEMFHCGGTAIVYNVTGHEEFIRHDVNGLVVEMGDEKAILENLNLLKHHPEVLDRLKMGARETSRTWPDWEISSRRFEAALRSTYGQSRESRSNIGKMTENNWAWAESDVRNLDGYDELTGNRSDLQSCQVFWHLGDGYTEANSKKIGFESERWVTLEFRLMLTPGNIYLRIDPCMQPGVIYLERIGISEGNTDKTLLQCGEENRWNGAEVAGTASVIGDTGDLVVNAFGEDPQILLQPFEIARDGDGEFRLEISLKRLSFPMRGGDLLYTLGKESSKNMKSKDAFPSSRTPYSSQKQD